MVRVGDMDTHYWYMRGLRGEDAPLSENPSVVEGWLAGALDREKGVLATPYMGSDGQGQVPPELTHGRKVLIRKGVSIFSPAKGWRKAGRNYKATVHHVNPGSDAYYSHTGVVVRPTEAAVVWVGSGQYWCEASVSDILVPDLAVQQKG